MITASLIALSLLQSAIPAASVTARADLGSMVWELFGPAEPVLAPSSVAAEPADIPLRQTVDYWTDEGGCVRPTGWAGLCRHYPVHTASPDALLAVATSVPPSRFGDPLPASWAALEAVSYGCTSGVWCRWASYYNPLSWAGSYNGKEFGVGYYWYYRDESMVLQLQREMAREFVETSAGLRAGKELEARGLIGGQSQGSGYAGGGSSGSGFAGGGYSGSGNFGGSAPSTASAGSGYSSPSSGGGRGGSSGGGKPGADLP